MRLASRKRGAHRPDGPEQLRGSGGRPPQVLQASCRLQVPCWHLSRLLHLSARYCCTDSRDPPQRPSLAFASQRFSASSVLQQETQRGCTHATVLHTSSKKYPLFTQQGDENIRLSKALPCYSITCPSSLAALLIRLGRKPSIPGHYLTSLMIPRSMGRNDWLVSQQPLQHRLSV